MEKRIWFSWLQGIDATPAVVKACLASWIKLNPGWQLQFIDWASLPALFPGDKALIDRFAHGGSIHPTVASDLIRVNLLTRHGGVWVDATCLCRKPLDSWLPPLTRHGFFAFHAPGSDRILSNWFLSAELGNPIVSRWCQMMNHYWNSNFPRVQVSIDDLMISPEFNAHRSNRALWFDETRPEYSTQCPYFWPHYLFERALFLYPDMAAHWNSMPKVTADIPHRLQTIGLGRPVDERVRLEFALGMAPLFKLTHKTELSTDDTSTVFGYALDPANW